jgi:hypothetical protein
VDVYPQHAEAAADSPPLLASVVLNSQVIEKHIKRNPAQIRQFNEVSEPLCGKFLLTQVATYRE